MKNNLLVLIFLVPQVLLSVLAGKVIDEFMQGTFKAMEFVERSFLSNEAKKKYIKILGDRHRCLGLR